MLQSLVWICTIFAWHASSLEGESWTPSFIAYGWSLRKDSMASYRNVSRLQCIHACMVTDLCNGVNYDDSGMVCELFRRFQLYLLEPDQPNYSTEYAVLVGRVDGW